MYIASVLIGPDGSIIGVHHKHALWDYEYTLFTPGDEPYCVYSTPVRHCPPWVPAWLLLLAALTLVTF